MSVDLVLASGSASRRLMLENAGLRLKVIKPQIDEDSHRVAMRAEGISISDQAMHLAELKALKVSQTTDHLVLGGDQMLNLEGTAFDKPASLDAARDHLKQLSGRSHILETAIVIAHSGQLVWRHLARPRLTMRALSEPFIDAYIAACGPDLCTTVGAYMLEARGAQLFSTIEGDFFSVRGLPLLPLLGYMRDRGIIAS